MIIDPSTATLEFLNGYTPLTTAASDGICLAAELPEGITSQDSPSLVVLTLGPSPPSDIPIYRAVFTLRCYGPSFVEAYAIYQHLYALLYDAGGRATGGCVVNDRWVLRSADLTKPQQFTEPDGWLGYRASLRTRWNLMELS